MNPVPAARGQTHWPAVAAAVGAGIACAINVGKVPPTLPLLREQFALTLVQAGWVSAMLNTFAVAASLAIGFLSARLGALPMAIGGLLIGAAASLAGRANHGVCVFSTDSVAAFIGPPNHQCHRPRHAWPTINSHSYPPANHFVIDYTPRCGYSGSSP